ncbi:MAG: twin-arginine translocase TatA/TatE family subunit [Nitratireductor sp.]
MGQIGIWQIVIIGVVVVLLFGRGKISGVMGDVAKGINAFKKGIKDDAEEVAEEATQTIDQKATETVSAAKKKAKS